MKRNQLNITGGNNISPCMKCTARHLGCHDGCEEYKVWAEKNRLMKKNRRKENGYLDYDERGTTYGI